MAKFEEEQKLKRMTDEERAAYLAEKEEKDRAEEVP